MNWLKRFCLAVLVAVFSVQSANAVSLSIESLTWADYDLSLDDSFSRVSGGNFYISRSYLTLKASFDDRISARVTYDFAKSGDVNDSYLKYAYASFKFADELELTAGLMKTYFAYQTYWNYALPTKNINDVVKASSSADFGIGLSGKLADGLFNYYVTLLNGESYKAWTETDADNDDFSGVATVKFNYLEKSSAAVSYRIDPADDTMAFGAYNYTEVNDFNGLLEYVGTKAGNADVENALSATLGYWVNEKFEALARVDYPLESDPSLYLGVLFNPNDNINIKPMIVADFGNTMSYEFKTEMAIILKAKTAE